MMITIKKIIEGIVSNIEAEAAYDGQPELCDCDYLYECFKNNIKFDTVKGNWQVLKYYAHVVAIKLAKAMIGDWTFNDRDAEMINYFGSMDMDNETKTARNRMLRLKSPKVKRGYYNGYWDLISIFERIHGEFGGMYVAMLSWLDYGKCDSDMFFSLSFVEA